MQSVYSEVDRSGVDRSGVDRSGVDRSGEAVSTVLALVTLTFSILLYYNNYTVNRVCCDPENYGFTKDLRTTNILFMRICLPPSLSASISASILHACV